MNRIRLLIIGISLFSSSVYAQNEILNEVMRVTDSLLGNGSIVDPVHDIVVKPDSAMFIDVNISSDFSDYNINTKTLKYKYVINSLEKNAVISMSIYKENDLMHIYGSPFIYVFLRYRIYKQPEDEDCYYHDDLLFCIDFYYNDYVITKYKVSRMSD